MRFALALAAALVLPSTAMADACTVQTGPDVLALDASSPMAQAVGTGWGFPPTNSIRINRWQSGLTGPVIQVVHGGVSITAWGSGGVVLGGKYDDTTAFRVAIDGQQLSVEEVDGAPGLVAVDWYDDDGELLAEIDFDGMTSFCTAQGLGLLDQGMAGDNVHYVEQRTDYEQLAWEITKMGAQGEGQGQNANGGQDILRARRVVDSAE